MLRRQARHKFPHVRTCEHRRARLLVCGAGVTIFARASAAPVEVVVGGGWRRLRLPVLLAFIISRSLAWPDLDFVFTRVVFFFSLPCPL